MSFTIIYITYPSEAEAKRISELLLEQRLIACVNLFPITSAYWWQGSITHDSEWVGLVKTTEAGAMAVETFVEEHHPYDVPCIMQLSARANAAYEAWIEASVSSIGMDKD